MSLRPIFRPRAALASLFAGAILAWAAATPARAGAAARPVVVELYTSQGCSSCPPADALLGRLAGRKDVLALSLPVTYWDMLGWKDTLASKANTNRQKAYAKAMGRGGIYTPQMIVDGTVDLVGSRDGAVEKAIAAREAHLTDVPVALDLTPGEIRVTVGAGKAKADATIWMFRVRPSATVKIGKGENGGRTVTYSNVVRVVKAIGIWKGREVRLDLPRDSMGGSARDGFAVVVQQNGYGPILGATPVETVDFTALKH